GGRRVGVRPAHRHRRPPHRHRPAHQPQHHHPGGAHRGRRHRARRFVVATDAHPFWVPSLATWVAAIDLEPGTWLRTSAGTWVQVRAVAVRTAEAQRVHNLTVADLHTYYVAAGAADALVHNEAGCIDK